MATVILMIVTITYKFVLVVIGVGIAVLGRGFLHQYLEGILPVFYLGLGLNIFCVTFMTVLVFHPDLARNFLVKGLKILERLHLLRKRESRLKKLEDSMDTYRETAAYLKGHPRVIFNVILITFAQRMALFAVTWFVYRALSLSGTGFWDDPVSAGRDFCFCRHAAPSGRNGNQRDTVPEYFCTRFLEAVCYPEWY